MRIFNDAPEGPPGTPGDDYRLVKGPSPIFIPKRKKFKRKGIRRN